MTDEQLLQLIDFNATLNYWIEKENKSKPVSVVVSEEDARSIVEDKIERLYTVNIENMNCFSDYTDGKWSFMFEPQNLHELKTQNKDYWVYFGELYPNSYEVLFIDSFFSGRLKESQDVPVDFVPTTDEYSIKSEELLQNIFENNTTVQFKKIMSYVPIEKGKSIYTVFEVEGHHYYEIELSYPDKNVIGYYVYDNKDQLDAALKNKLKNKIQ